MVDGRKKRERLREREEIVERKGENHCSKIYGVLLSLTDHFYVASKVQCFMQNAQEEENRRKRSILGNILMDDPFILSYRK